jgi:hypothetical protein
MTGEAAQGKNKMLPTQIDPQLDALLAGATTSPAPTQASLDRIASTFQPTLKPVRPLANPWLLTAGLVAAAALVALAGAARAGFNGFHKMTTPERAAIFSILAACVLIAARKLVAERTPGSRSRISAASLSTITALALLAVFALIFQNYQTTHFISAGILCLVTGLLHAIPTALLAWLIVRRGFSVNANASGLIAGTLAGLAGVALLELHCPNFEALHILIWHTAVLPASAAAGALLAWHLHQRSSKI